MSDIRNNTYLFGGNSVFIEEIYEKYLEDPNSVDKSWQDFFKDFSDNKNDLSKIVNGPSWQKRDVTITKVKAELPAISKDTNKAVDNKELLYIKSIRMIDKIREKGHFLAKLDPLEIEVLPNAKDIGLSLEDFGFNQEDLQQEVDIKNYVSGISKISVLNLYNFMLKIYAGNMGVETSHMNSDIEKNWIYEQLESTFANFQFSQDEQKRIASTLIEAEGFEKFLHFKFPGAKRFSVEGGESTLVAAEESILYSANFGVERIILGMAHRGRLNMLTKIMGKPYHAMLSEFQGNLAYPEDTGFSGDVKYHLGYSSIKKTNNDKEISISMVPNPSHLETVNPVVMGKVRAEQTEQELLGKPKESVMSILLHGDAAFIGQGVVAESLMIGTVSGYNVSGTIHIITNNQVGFTANPHNGRSTRYPSEFAKSISVPIFHVNGDYPELVAKIARIMVSYRMAFKKDVVMNLVCFRTHGHNEADEPNFTQPIMYKKVSKHPGTSSKYIEYLTSNNLIDSQFFETHKEKFRSFLDNEFELSKSYKPNKPDWLEGRWSHLQYPDQNREEPVTGVAIESLKKIGMALTTYPKDFNINSKIKRQLDNKKESIESGQNIDWATAEALAFGSILTEGFKVRLSGQDAGRGTFSQRHSVFHDQETAATYIPLNNIQPNQAMYEVVDSALSEYAVMGFEYGYAFGDPNALVIWEGQFGDFSNGAQIIIDQYISAAERKWFRMNGLVLLLPHGYEGQGPEHSSARLERYLQLCAEDNMQVVNCSTPASYFHVLRRQICNNFRKPLIVMTPKSLLRHKDAVSNLDEMAENTKFQPVIDDHEIDKKTVKKVVMCSGKIYYNILEGRRKTGDKSIAIVRIEQFYPFPALEISNILKTYKNAEFIWCQEEPKNMGAYSFLHPKLEELLGMKVNYIGRNESASPATGYTRIHDKEQNEILAKIFS